MLEDDVISCLFCSLLIDFLPVFQEWSGIQMNMVSSASTVETGSGKNTHTGPLPNITSSDKESEYRTESFISQVHSGGNVS